MSFCKQHDHCITRAAKWAGGVVLAIAILGGGLLVGNWRPLIGKILSDVLTLSLVLTGIGLLLFSVFDPRLRHFIWQQWLKLIARLWSMAHPHAAENTAEYHLAQLQQDIKHMQIHASKLKKERVQLSHIIYRNKEKIQSLLYQAAHAPNSLHRQLALRKAGRLRYSNDKLKVLDRKMGILAHILDQLAVHTLSVCQDLEQIVAQQNEQHLLKQIEATTPTANSIRSDRTSIKKAHEIHQLIQQAITWIRSLQPQVGIFDEKGLEKLEEWAQHHYHSPNNATKRLTDKSATSSPFDSLFDDLT